MRAEATLNRIAIQHEVFLCCYKRQSCCARAQNFTRTMQALFKKLTKRNSALRGFAPNPVVFGAYSSKLMQNLSAAYCLRPWRAKPLISNHLSRSARERLPLSKFSPGLFQKAASSASSASSAFPASLSSSTGADRRGGERRSAAFSHRGHRHTPRPFRYRRSSRARTLYRQSPRG